ncbi:MAG: DUF2207 domain-containing protein [Chromatiaceae bacterium]|nr:DUF2207 domain-containing protein [Chromatiaceae bacterium]
MPDGRGRWAKWLLWLLVLAGSATATYAEEIRDYQVDLTASAEGTLLVQERIDYDFGGVQRHGIYRDIPNTVPAPWGGRRRLDISEISIEQDGEAAVSAEESVHGDAGPMLRLRVGDPGHTISGRHAYILSYQVADALLPAGKRDAFRWNAIGTGWDVPIRAARIRLNLPTALRGRDDLEPRFFTGPWGSTGRSGRSEWNPAEGVYSVATGPLAPHEGVTLEVSFPAGAIPATAHPSGVELFRLALPHLWAWPVMLLGLGLAWRHWNRIGRDPGTGPVVVRYQPPNGLEAAEAGLLIDQSLDKADLTGAVIELARDGWIKIEHPNEGGLIQKLIKRSRVTLERLRPRDEWDKLPPYKRYLLESFFCRGDRFSPGGVEDAAVVRERNRWLDKAKARIHERGVEHGLFPENPRTVRIKYLAGAALLGALLLWLAFWRSNMAPEIKFLTIAGPVFVAIIAFFGFRTVRQGRGAVLWLVVPVAAAIFILAQLLSVVPNLFDFVFRGWGAILVDPLGPTLLLVLGLLVFAWQMPRRTALGARAQSELLGFEKFMRRAEEPRLRLLLQEDPSYFERTLPFAALFGLVAEWTGRFEGLVATPTWYEGGSFDHLGRDMNQLRGSGVSSSPPAKSGGSSGGGGFSGGGGGGGGGGSW